jgi:putative adhesin
MISRSTLVGALVVTELVILAAAGQAISGGGPAYASGSTPGTHTHFGFVFRNYDRHHGVPAATSTVDRTFAAGLTPHVVVDVRDVPVTVQTGSLPAVHVVGTVRRSGFRHAEDGVITAVQTADGVRVTAGDTSDLRGSFERTLRLTVPAGASVEIASGGAVQASGLRAKLIAHVSDGAIHVSNQRGDVDLSTASGTVELVDVQADAIVARTDDGHVKLTSVGADHFDVHTASGEIAATDLRAVDGALTTADGAVGVTFAANSDATVNIHTSDGSIMGAGGQDGTEAAESRTMRLGSARGNFTVSTDSGSITISQGATV